MKSLPLFSKSMLLLVLMACVYQPAYAKKMHKWTDENGKTYYSDKIPPEHKDFKHESLDKDARVVETTEKTKSKQELAMEKNLEKIKAQQEKLLKAQSKYDKSLLSNFPTDRDMKRSHRTKLRSLSDAQAALDDKILDLKKVQQEQAAKHEQNNQKIPDETLKAIENIQKKTAKIKDEIEQSSVTIKKNEKKFAADLVRYQLLSRSKKSTSTNGNELKNEQKKTKNELGLFVCEDKAQCDKAWSITHKFIRANSSTPVIINSDKLIVSDKSNSNKISLSASKMTSKNKDYKIFLDVHCSADKSICLTKKAQELRERYPRFIRTSLGISAK